jgi:hypothetical protein
MIQLRNRAAVTDDLAVSFVTVSHDFGLELPEMTLHQRGQTQQPEVSYAASGRGDCVHGGRGGVERGGGEGGAERGGTGDFREICRKRLRSD